MNKGKKERFPTKDDPEYYQCQVEGCTKRAILLSPSLEKPRQWCRMHAEEKMQKSYEFSQCDSFSITHGRCELKKGHTGKHKRTRMEFKTKEWGAKE